MLRFGSRLLALIVWLGLGATILQAADAQSARHYGAGVHDFYQGRYFEAVRNFDLAIGYGSQDPRIYFFRGLANQRLGYSGNAHADFMLGSQLEVALKRRDIGMALQRVQGPDRLTIERYRREARQLPEQMVREVIRPPVTPRVQRSVAPRPPQATKAQYALTNLPEDASDPFRAEAPGLLGRGEFQAVSEQPAVSDGQGEAADAFADDFGGDEPFGSGVVAEAESDDGSADPFAFGGDSADKGTTDAAPRGAVGAALRAFGRSIAPAGSIAEQGQKLLGNARGSAAPSDTDEDMDPFATPADDGGTVEDDAGPFATPADDGGTVEDDADPFATPADTPQQPVEQGKTPDDAGDPFTDDDDPFAF